MSGAAARRRRSSARDHRDRAAPDYRVRGSWSPGIPIRRRLRPARPVGRAKAEQLRDRHDPVAARTQRGDDRRVGGERLAAEAAAVVGEDDRAWPDLCEDARDDRSTLPGVDQSTGSTFQRIVAMPNERATSDDARCRPRRTAGGRRTAYSRSVHGRGPASLASCQRTLPAVTRSGCVHVWSPSTSPSRSSRISMSGSRWRSARRS